MAITAEADGRQSAARPKVFLSYTRADIDSAKPIITLLENAGIEVWWDGLLEGGVTYLHTTEAALEGADCVVVLWSAQSVQSNWVRDEAQSGRERQCLVPLTLDGTMAPLGFRQIQLIDISGWNGDPQASVAQGIVTSVFNQVDGTPSEGMARTTPQPNGAASPFSTNRTGISRRAMIIGGLALTGSAATLGAWQFGLLGSADENSLSMAVLSFANLTGGEDQEWFSKGLSNELRQALARNPLLQVSAPTSSTSQDNGDDFALARLLGVSSILRGSVQRAGETIRISAELVRVEDGLVRWAETYDRKFDDILAVQSEIAKTVAFSLTTQIVSEDEAKQGLEAQKDVGGTDDIAAYEAFLRGMAFFDLSSGEDSDRSGLDQFERAIAADPDYAAAHAMRARMLGSIANKASDAGEIARLYDQSIVSAQKAITLEPKLAVGHLALGFALNNGRLDRAAAYPHYQQAEKLAAGDANIQRSTAVFYGYGEQQELATQMIDRVLELDPLNAQAFRSAGYVALFARDYGKTLERMAEAISLNPQIAGAHYAIAVAKFMQGDVAGAQTAFEAEPVPLFSQTGVAITSAKLGNRELARSTLDALVAEYGDAALYQQAQVHAQWGQSDQAIAELQRAFEENDPGALLAPNDPLLDPIRDRAELDRMLARLKTA